MYLVIEQYNETLDIFITDHTCRNTAIRYCKQEGYHNIRSHSNTNGNTMLKGKMNYNTCLIIPNIK